MNKTNRLPGFFYLGMIVFGTIAKITSSKIFVSDNIGGLLLPLRLSFISDLIMMVFYLLTAWALYTSLKYFHKPLSLLFLIFTIVSAAILSGNMINHFAIIEIHHTAYFMTDNVQSLTRFLGRLHEYGYLIAQVYFGLWLLPLGMIILKSKIMPAYFGIMLIAAMCGHLLEVLVQFLLPGYDVITYPGLIVGMIGEFSFCFWLLLRGLPCKESRPKTMVLSLSFFLIAIIVFFLGVNQIIGKKQRISLNWYFFAICMLVAVSCFNFGTLYYQSFIKGVEIAEAFYLLNKANMALSSSLIMIFPLFFAFILKLSKIQSRALVIVQFSMFAVTAVYYCLVFFVIFAFTNAFEILNSTVFNVTLPLIFFVPLCFLILLLYKWLRSTLIKREHAQAVRVSLASIILFSFNVGIMLGGKFYLFDLITYIGALVFLLICNHYANQYNISFNTANLAAYVYSAVKLPVLIVDETGGIILCNTASELFLKKNNEQLTTQKLFDLFDFENTSWSISRYKKDNTVFNSDALCHAEGQKCQISLNYIYDKYDEMICTVVIVTDITEKENLIQQLNEANAKIERYNQELQIEVDRQTESIRNLQKAIVYSMSDLIEKKDGYTGVHTRRVSGYVTILLREMVRRGFQLNESEIQRIAESSLLHDMGKIAITDNILLKNGKLNDDEFNVMKSHSTAGADSLQKSMQFAKDNDFLKNAFVMAKHHHEKWNGCGYPDGKKEQEIPLLARVIAIADVYDALRSKRSYKQPFSREKTKSIILEETGRQFDPELVDVFLAVEHEFNDFCESNKND